MSNIATMLKKLRIENNLNQTEMAEKCHTSRYSYNLWENGHREPSRKSCQIICDEFGISLDYLLGFSRDHIAEIKQITIPITKNGKMTQENLTFPVSILDPNNIYWAERKGDSGNLAIYDNETKQIIMVISKF